MEAVLCGSRRSGVRVSKLRRVDGEVEDGVTNNVDILNEIFKHLDPNSLGKAACVSSKWRQATEEAALWEAICSRRLSPAFASPAPGRLKSVVVAFGGFKRFYVNYVRKFPGGSGGPKVCTSASRKKWSKDEVYLSLSLFSIDCYERIAPKTSALCSSSSFAGSLCKPSFNSDPSRLLAGWKGKCADQVENMDTNC